MLHPRQHLVLSLSVFQILTNSHGAWWYLHFNLHFSDDMQCGTSLHMLICHLCLFFDEVSVKVFASFFFFFWFSYVELQEFFVYVGQQSFIRYIFSSIFSQSMAI